MNFGFIHYIFDLPWDLFKIQQINIFGEVIKDPFFGFSFEYDFLTSYICLSFHNMYSCDVAHRFFAWKNNNHTLKSIFPIYKMQTHVNNFVCAFV